MNRHGPTTARETWGRHDVMEALNVGEHTLREWMLRQVDPIPHVRAGRRVLFDPELVREWFRQQALHHGPTSDLPGASPLPVFRAVVADGRRPIFR